MTPFCSHPIALLPFAGDALGDVPRNSAIGCGAIVMDVTSTSPRGRKNLGILSDPEVTRERREKESLILK